MVGGYYNEKRHTDSEWDCMMRDTYNQALNDFYKRYKELSPCKGVHLNDGIMKQVITDLHKELKITTD